MIKKYGMYIIIAILLLGASIMIFIQLNPKELPSNLMSATGKIDGDLTTLNTKYPGRIETINIEDGQKIQMNETIAILKSDEYREKLRALNESVDAAKNSLQAMQNELAITKKTIALNIKKAQKGVLIAKNKKRQLSHAVQNTQSLKEQNKKDYERAKSLYEKALIAKQKVEYSQLTLSTTTNKLQALQQQMDESQRAIEIAQDNYKLALTQKKKIQTLQSNINATKNKVKALEANRDEVQIVINELTIKSPINGYVMEKVANKGEVLGAGMVVATLIEPQSLYLKVFVDTMKNGKVKIGDAAVIFLDAYPDKAIKAKVVSIAANAEFTPKDVAVRSDRIQRVFAVHLKPLKVEPLLKIGIPAVGVISIDGKGLPTSLNDIPSI